MPEKKKRRRGLSLGSWVMLIFTTTVLMGCFGFMTRIAGDDMNAENVLHVLTQTIEIPALRGRQAQNMPGATAVPAKTTAAPTPTPQPHVTPTPAPTARVVEIQAVGTIAAPKNVRQSVYASESKTYDFTEIFEGVRDTLVEGDLTIATVETTFAGKEAGYGSYNAPVQLLDALKTSGVDLLSLGTERALEMGYDGLMETISQVQSRGFMYAGAYEREEDVGSAKIFQINDVQVAVLAYTYGLSDNSKDKTKKANRFSVPTIDLETMKNDIVTARKAGAELVIVLPHWGTKNKEATNSDVYALAQSLADAGADIILGAHSNIVQGVEKLTAQRADGTTPDCYVAYSLGSFLTDSRDAANTAGVILSLRVEVDPVTRRLTITQPQYVPTYIRYFKDDGLYRYPIVKTTDEALRAQLSEKERKALEKAHERIVSTMGDAAALRSN